MINFISILLLVLSSNFKFISTQIDTERKNVSINCREYECNNSAEFEKIHKHFFNNTQEMFEIYDINNFTNVQNILNNLNITEIETENNFKNINNKVSQNIKSIVNERHSAFYEEDGTPVAWYYLQNVLEQVKPIIQETSTNCKEDTLVYLEHLSNFTLWAVQMYDASVKLPFGILAGNNLQLGQFDQCLNVVGPPVRAQYCLADVQIEPEYHIYPSFHRKPEEYINPFSLEYEMLASAWEKLILPIDPSKRRRDLFRWAICVPESCAKDDVSTFLQNGLQQLGQSAGVRVNVSIGHHSCTKGETKPWTAGEIVMGVILLMSVLTMVLTSVYDMLIYQKRSDKEKQPARIQTLMLSFSLYTNMVKLFKPESSTELSSMHGMKVYTMFLVMLGHRCLHNYGGPFFNPEFLEERYRKFQDMFLLNGTLITDTFFMLSGFLTAFSLVREIAMRRRIHLPTIFIYRWMRITPLYMINVGIYATLLIRLGDGPVWDERVGREVERCQQNWWLNLLYLNNYINVNQLCMFQSWYISCDMHYFIFGTLLVVLCAKFKKYIWYILGSVLFVSILIPFLMTLVGRYDGVLRVYMSLLVDPSANDFYNYLYITSHTRAGPYIVGMISAYIYLLLKKRQIKFKSWAMWVGSALAILLSLGGQFGAWSFYIPGREYYVLESALYAGLHRVSWAIAMAWIVIASATTSFGILQPIISHPGLVPLSRLTYSAFLCHGIIQLYTVSSVRMPIYMSFPRLFWMVAGDIILSFILALIMHLLFEAPINGIQKLLLAPAKTNGGAVKTKAEQKRQIAAINNNNDVINMDQNAQQQIDIREDRF